MPMTKATFLLAMYAVVGIAQTHSTSEGKARCQEVLGKAYREDLCREVLGSPDAVPVAHADTSERKLFVFPGAFVQGETDAVTLTNNSPDAVDVIIRWISEDGKILKGRQKRWRDLQEPKSV